MPFRVPTLITTRTVPGIRRAMAALLTLFVAMSIAPVQAQFNPKRTLILGVICGGTAYGGFRIGDRLADMAIAKSKLMGEAANKMRLSFRVGVAAAACTTSTVLANTIYGRLSKRDRDARKREMQAALEDAQPGTRQYVLPDSRWPGTLETMAAEQDGNRECRVQIDTLGSGDEPASAKWCRKNASDRYEVDLGV